MSRDPGFEPAKKQVEPQQKGGRKYAGLRQQILPGGEAILQGAPEIQPPCKRRFNLCMNILSFPRRRE